MVTEIITNNLLTIDITCKSEVRELTYLSLFHIIIKFTREFREESEYLKWQEV